MCFDYKVVSVEYFLDRLEGWETNDIIANIKYTDRVTKELSRYAIYAIAQTGSTKKLSIEDDIMKLPWDDEFKNKGTKVSDEEAKKMQERMKQLEKQMQMMTFTPFDMNTLSSKK